MEVPIPSMGQVAVSRGARLAASMELMGQTEPIRLRIAQAVVAEEVRVEAKPETTEVVVDEEEE